MSGAVGEFNAIASTLCAVRGDSGGRATASGAPDAPVGDAMMHGLFAGWLTWQGLFVGVAQTNVVRHPFGQPGVSVSALAVASIGKVNMSVLWIQPVQRNGYGPALQFGASVRVF